MRRDKPRFELRRDRRLRTAPTRDNDHVGTLQQLGPRIGQNLQSSMCSQRSWFDRGAGKPIPSGAHLGSGEAEDLSDDAELKRTKPIVDERDNEWTMQRSGFGLNVWHDLYVYCYLRQL